MKSTKITPAVQLEQVLDVCVDVSKRKLNVYFELDDQAIDEWAEPIVRDPSCRNTQRT